MKNAAPTKPLKATKIGLRAKPAPTAPSATAPASGRTIAHESALAQVAGAAT